MQVAAELRTAAARRCAQYRQSMATEQVLQQRACYPCRLSTGEAHRTAMTAIDEQLRWADRRSRRALPGCRPVEAWQEQRSRRDRHRVDRYRQAIFLGCATVQTLHRRSDSGIAHTGDAKCKQVACVRFAGRQPHLGSVGKQLFAERRLSHESGCLRYLASGSSATIAHENTVRWIR